MSAHEDHAARTSPSSWTGSACSSSRVPRRAARVDRRRAPQRVGARPARQGGARADHAADAPPRVRGDERQGDRVRDRPARRGDAPSTLSASTVAIHAQVIARNLEPFVDLLARLLATPTFPRGRARAPEARDGRPRSSRRATTTGSSRRRPSSGRSSPGTPTGATPAGRRAVEADRAGGRRCLLRAPLRPQQRRPRLRRRRDGEADAPLACPAPRRGLAHGRRSPTPSPRRRRSSGRQLLFVDKPERTQTQILLGTLGTSPHDPDHVPSASPTPSSAAPSPRG